MAETLSLTGANGVSEIHIETGLLDRAGAVILETFSPSRVRCRSTDCKREHFPHDNTENFR